MSILGPGAKATPLWLGALALLHPPPEGPSKWPGLLLALCLACESRDRKLLKEAPNPIGLWSFLELMLIQKHSKTSRFWCWSFLCCFMLENTRQPNHLGGWRRHLLFWCSMFNDDAIADAWPPKNGWKQMKQREQLLNSDLFCHVILHQLLTPRRAEQHAWNVWKEPAAKRPTGQSMRSLWLVGDGFLVILGFGWHYNRLPLGIESWDLGWFRSSGMPSCWLLLRPTSRLWDRETQTWLQKIADIHTCYCCS